MQLTVEIPDDLVGRLEAAGGDLSRRVLEAFALGSTKAVTLQRAKCAAFSDTVLPTNSMDSSRPTTSGLITRSMICTANSRISEVWGFENGCKDALRNSPRFYDSGDQHYWGAATSLIPQLSAVAAR